MRQRSFVSLTIFGILTFGPHMARYDALAVTVTPRKTGATNDEARALARELQPLYQELHKHPELGYHEVNTAHRIAAELKSAGYEVMTGLGGTGVAGVMHNGTGPTVMLRTELDALPVTEETGLPFASHDTASDEKGQPVGVMHACGHDLHMTNIIGTARWLATHKSAWQGTVELVAQPAEEGGAGAKAMLKDGLYKRIPKPDLVLAMHSFPELESGKVGYRDGAIMAGSNSATVTLKGRGGHGASPQTTIDPIVLSAAVILDLQTIVSREIDPTEPSVVTVGSIHGGTKGNVIPDSVQLKLTLRATTDETMKKLGESVKRHVRGIAAAHGAPEPNIEISPEPYLPTINDHGLVQRAVPTLEAALGKDSVKEIPMTMGSEDFGDFGRDARIPILMLRLGTTSSASLADALRKGTPLPSLHSSSFQPDAPVALATGIRSMTALVTNLLPHAAAR